MSHRPHCLKAPWSPGEAFVAPRDQAQPCFASATTRWYGRQPPESSSFSEVCLLYKHNRKRRAKCKRWPAAPSQWGRRGPASHHVVRLHKPYSLQTPLGWSTLERLRGGEGSWEKRRKKQPRSYAKLLPGSKALLDSKIIRFPLVI